MKTVIQILFLNAAIKITADRSGIYSVYREKCHVLPHIYENVFKKGNIHIFITKRIYLLSYTKNMQYILFLYRIFQNYKQA